MFGGKCQGQIKKNGKDDERINLEIFRLRLMKSLVKILNLQFVF